MARNGRQRMVSRQQANEQNMAEGINRGCSLMGGGCAMIFAGFALMILVVTVLVFFGYIAEVVSGG